MWQLLLEINIMRLEPFKVLDKEAHNGSYRKGKVIKMAIIQIMRNSVRIKSQVKGKILRIG